MFCGVHPTNQDRWSALSGLWQLHDRASDVTESGKAGKTSSPNSNHRRPFEGTHRRLYTEHKLNKIIEWQHVHHSTCKYVIIFIFLLICWRFWSANNTRNSERRKWRGFFWKQRSTDRQTVRYSDLRLLYSFVVVRSVKNGRLGGKEEGSFLIPSIASKRVHVRNKRVLIECKHDMFCRQTFEV